MRRNKVGILVFISLSCWISITYYILIQCPGCDKEEDVSPEEETKLGKLEGMIDRLSSDTNGIVDDFQGHLTDVKSNVLLDKIKRIISKDKEKKELKEILEDDVDKDALRQPLREPEFLREEPVNELVVDHNINFRDNDVNIDIPRLKHDVHQAVIEKMNREEDAKIGVLEEKVTHDNVSYLVDRMRQYSSAKLVNGPIIGVLVFSCNRVTVKRCLDQLLKWRPSKVQFPIIVSQDCNHQATTDAIMSYGNQLTLIRQPDQSDIQVPPKEKKFKGYFKIARHYGWALNQTFNNFGFETAIIIEDDLDIAPDMFEYFLGTYNLLHEDKSLWCVSAWNDNGKTDLLDASQPSRLHRTDFFPGLGWMLTKSVWMELAAKWPQSYWDDWIRKPEQRKERACIRPELSRTKTFGKVGVSNGMFYEKHLKFIKLSEEFVPFTQMDLTYLKKETYDNAFVKEVYSSPVVSYQELKTGNIVPAGSVRIPYYNKDQYKKAAKALGLMDDFRSGVPRTAYRGVVSFFFKARRVFLAPPPNWTNYDLTWS